MLQFCAFCGCNSGYLGITGERNEISGHLVKGPETIILGIQKKTDAILLATMPHDAALEEIFYLEEFVQYFIFLH